MQNVVLPRRSVWIVFALLFVLPQQSFAWIDTGHEMIASIAFDEVSPAVRKEANDILKQHPRFEKDLLEYAPEGFDKERYAFMIAATWPDMIKVPTHPMRFVANHPAWHYIDIPFVEPGYTAAPPPPETKTAGDPANIVDALAKVSAEFRNPSTPPADRAIALCWILHLVGDLHQPLHATSYFSAQYPEGDRGGNLELLLQTPNQFYSQINLHLLWDEMLGTYRSPEMINYVAQGLRSDPRFARANLSAELAKHEVSAWAKESYDLAVSQVYLNGKLQTANQNAVRSDKKLKVPPVPPGYRENGETVAAKQAVLAGYRAADLITTLLSAPAASAVK